MAYPSPMPVLEALRDLLGAVPGVQTSRIGLEATMTPEDYPIVRIVPSRVGPSDFISELRATECLIYFGRPIHEFTDGLEALYAELFTMEAALIAALPRSGDWVAQWRETITDEDRNDAYKLMALRVQVDG